MRIIFNILLVILALPAIFIAPYVISLFIPTICQTLTWKERLGPVGLWLVSLTAFSFVYYLRARWFKSSGIFKSWRGFKEYMRERHNPPEVSAEEIKDFATWLGLDPKDLFDIPKKGPKEIYKRINSEFKEKKITEEKKKSYIKCLACFYKNK